MKDEFDELDKLKDEFDELDKLKDELDELYKLKDEFDELDKLNCKFDELDKLKDEFDELDKLKDEFDELDKLSCNSCICSERKYENNFVFHLKLSCIIRITCPCDLYPLTPHFFLAKLGFTIWYSLFSNFCSKTSIADNRLNRLSSNVIPRSMF